MAVGFFDEDGVFHSDSPHGHYRVSNFWPPSSPLQPSLNPPPLEQFPP